MFQEVIAEAPRIAQMSCPRRMLVYLGRSAERSVAMEMEFADILTTYLGYEKGERTKECTCSCALRRIF